MLHSIQQQYGKQLSASDGTIGHLRDFYFDDKHWAVRYLVADTGGWLPGRLVLISPHALRHLSREGRTLFVDLTRKQIEDSPPIDEHRPVSRQHEMEYYRHYGYLYYAESWPLWGLAGYPVLVPPPPAANSEAPQGDAHLRNTQNLTGYYIEATDGVIGKVADFMLDDMTWAIDKIVAECGHWFSGMEMLIPTVKVSRISYDQSTIYVDMTKAALIEAAKQPATETAV